MRCPVHNGSSTGRKHISASWWCNLLPFFSKTKKHNRSSRHPLLDSQSSGGCFSQCRAGRFPHSSAENSRSRKLTVQEAEDPATEQDRKTERQQNVELNLGRNQSFSDSPLGSAGVTTAATAGWRTWWRAFWPTWRRRTSRWRSGVRRKGRSRGAGTQRTRPVLLPRSNDKELFCSRLTWRKENKNRLLNFNGLKRWVI